MLVCVFNLRALLKFSARTNYYWVHGRLRAAGHENTGETINIIGGGVREFVCEKRAVYGFE